MMPEDALDQVAEASGIDRTQEWLFDSDDFPKVITSASLHANCTYGAAACTTAGSADNPSGESCASPQRRKSQRLRPRTLRRRRR
jgi:hypothetical protein